MAHNNAYALGMVLLIQQQKDLGHRPKRKLIPALVDKLVAKAHLKHDSREHYFRLKATCALLGLDSMCWYFKPIKKRRPDAAHVRSSHGDSGKRTHGEKSHATGSMSGM